ncbi:MAG: hypothetical protein GY811_25775, partial [Myxococcales bacterium]|nr:hypothetical protein [Myxococcales bacterium]
KSSYYIFVAASVDSAGAKTVDGYAFIGDQMGQHLASLIGGKSASEEKCCSYIHPSTP